MELELIILTFSYLGIFLLMIANGIFGFPSSQILYIISGYFISTGDLRFGLVLIAGALGNAIGNQILYELSRKRGYDYILKYLVIPKIELEKVRIAFKRKGIWFLIISKFFNPAKIIISIPAGISKMNRLIFFPIILITSAIWALAFISLGFIFGRNFMLASIYAPIFILVSIILFYLFYKYMNSKEILKELEKEKSS